MTDGRVAAAAAIPYGRDSVHVLLVECDPLTAIVTSRAFASLARVAKVTIAIDGQDALDRLQSGACSPYQLIIVSELSMPRVTGMELIVALRRRLAFEATPFAVLTASAAPLDRAEATRMQVQGYFVRAGRGDLLVRVLSWLSDHDTRLPLRPSR
ncbi:MAG TPA: response regulator [Kofleriaceae bacterium]|nr:response regulator [Kofleriaceae bacterium]